MGPELHPDLTSLAFLLGTWRGEGRGDYPTTRPFTFGEELVVEDAGDAFLLYAHRSWSLGDGAPLHFERGFIRPGAAPAEVELTLAHPLGLTEIAVGRVDGASLTFVSIDIGRTPTGAAVTGLARRYGELAGVLHYDVEMTMEDVPATWHTSSELRRPP